MNTGVVLIPSSHFEHVDGTITKSVMHGQCDVKHVATYQGTVALPNYTALCRAYFNVPTGTDVLGDLKSVLEGLVTRA